MARGPKSTESCLMSYCHPVFKFSKNWIFNTSAQFQCYTSEASSPDPSITLLTSLLETGCRALNSINKNGTALCHKSWAWQRWEMFHSKRLFLWRESRNRRTAHVQETILARLQQIYYWPHFVSFCFNVLQGGILFFSKKERGYVLAKVHIHKWKFTTATHEIIIILCSSSKRLNNI